MQNCTISMAEDKVIITYTDGAKQVFARQDFPKVFLQWQSHSRMKMFEMLQNRGDTAVKTMPGHLPTLATYGQEEFFVNLSTRGMGVLPKASLLDSVSELFEDAKRKAADKPMKESLTERVAAVKEFYCDHENFDTSVIGGLEIFEGQTANNIAKNPVASLLYSGEAPAFPSYQFNGVMEMITKENKYFRFLLAARELFAHDAFHIKQIHYPFGYLFHLSQVKNKTPFPKK